MSRDFAAVHERLKRILEPYRAEFRVTKDGPEGMALEIPGMEGKPTGYVAGTRMGKSYVSLLATVQARLAQVLSAARGTFSYADDGGRPRLEVPGLEGNPQGSVAQIAIRRRYVAYTLVPVYLIPELMDSASDELRRRFNGKGIFRFTTVDEVLFTELQSFTALAVDRYRPIAERKLAEAAARRR